MDELFLTAAEVLKYNTSHVNIEIDNTHYENSIPMELGYEWPAHKIQIIQVIKLAVRCNLKITMYSLDKEANDFIQRYYRELAGLDYLEEHPEELEVLYPWLIEGNQ